LIHCYEALSNRPPAVIDTNAPVSGILSLAGNQALILPAIHQGLARLCFSLRTDALAALRSINLAR
jgi:hypothetical protein